MDPGTILAISGLSIQLIDAAVAGFKRLRQIKNTYDRLPQDLEICKCRVLILQHYLELLKEPKHKNNKGLLLALDDLTSQLDKFNKVLQRSAIREKASTGEVLKLLKDANRISKEVESVSRILDNRVKDLTLGLFLVHSPCAPDTEDDHTPVARLPLARHYRLPWMRHVKTIGRDKELAELSQRLSKESEFPTFVNIHGLLGMGKTSLLLDLVQLPAIKDRFATIIWINATSSNAIRKQYGEIATQIAQRDAQFKSADAQIEFVVDVLTEEAKPVLFVFDDYDEALEMEDIMVYLPRDKHYVSVILKEGFRLDTTTASDVMLLQALEKDKARELLFQTSNQRPDMQNIVDANRLVTKLGYHPAAIVFVGHFIKTSKTTFEQFLRKFAMFYTQVFRNRGTSLLSQRNVAATWAMSLFDFCSQDQAYTQDIKDMLLFLVMTHSSVISGYFGKFIVNSPIDGLAWTKRCCRDGVWSDTAFFEIVQDLSDNSLIDIQDWRDNHCHFTVNHFVRKWLLYRAKTKDLIQTLLRVYELVSVGIENHKCHDFSLADQRHLRTYVHSCLVVLSGHSGIESMEETRETLKCHAKALLNYKHQFGVFLFNHLDSIPSHDDSELDLVEIFQQCIEGYRESCTDDDPIIVDLKDKIGNLYIRRGEFEKAESILKENLKLTGEIMSTTLANCYSKQGKKSEANKAYQEVMSTWDQLSTDQLLTSIKSYADNALANDDDVREEMLYLKIKEITDPDVDFNPLKAEALQSISQVYWYSRRQAEAVEIDLEALAIYDSLGQSSKLRWLQAAHNICRCYFSMEEWFKCEQLYCQVIQGYTEAYGGTDQHTSSARHCRSHALMSLGRYEDGRAQHALAFDNLLQNPGVTDSFTQDIFGCLSSVYEHGQRSEEKLTLYERTLEKASSDLPRGHPFKIRLLRTTAEMVSEKGDLTRAGTLLQELVAEQEKAITRDTEVKNDLSNGEDGVESEKEVSTNGNRVPCEDNGNDNGNGNDDGVDAENGDDDVENDDDDDLPQYTSDLENLAHNLRSMFMLGEAESIYRKVLTNKQRYCSASEDSILQTMIDLEFVCEDQGKSGEANEFRRMYMDASDLKREEFRTKYRKDRS